LGKTDFSVKIRKDFNLDRGSRDWLANDLMVELWESRPKVVEKKLEDESIQKEVVLDEES